MSEESKKPKTGLALLREPFPEHQISKLPKPTAAQTKAVKDNFKAGIRCQICGAWHHPDVVHLDYVGHAALTDRLLDCDPCWNWEPMALNDDGSPRFDSMGGMWIKLTVCGVARFGYGHPDGKTGGNAIKETIGDALRNAAMRFGAALDLWHKGALHLDDELGAVAEDSGPNPVSAAEAAILEDLATRAGTDRAAVFTATKIEGTSWADTPADMFVPFRDRMQAKLDAMEQEHDADIQRAENAAAAEKYDGQ